MTIILFMREIRGELLCPGQKGWLFRPSADVAYLTIFMAQIWMRCLGWLFERIRTPMSFIL